MKITNKKYTNFNLASEDERGENLIIDFIISSVFGLGIAFLTFKNFTLAFLVYLLVRFIYYFCFESSFSRTPGKYQTQTIVVNQNGEKPTIFQLIKRNLSRFISLPSGISDDERAIHDYLSNTFVIKNTKLKNIELNKIEIKQPLILIFNLSMLGFWIYIIGSKPRLKTLDIIILIVLVLTLIYALIFRIKKTTTNKVKK
ncbi:hypothetical protein A9Q86_09540 [Flavobacteriales bacterium 33_180_T64]|nr:hypothetical protein A9Q86_09540 [Flavobacteriales bacterium 33_180_T64]